MGLIEVIKSKLGLSQKGEAPPDPMVEARAQIAEARRLHGELEAQAALLAGQKRQISEEVEGAKAEVQKWEHLAARAAESGNEGAVTEAIIKKGEASRSLTVLQERLQDLQGTIDGLGVEEAGARLVNAQQELDQMVARGGASDIRERMARILGTGLGDSPSSTLAQVKDQVRAKEAKAAAWEEMSGGSRDAQRPSAEDDDIKAEVARIMAEAKKG